MSYQHTLRGRAEHSASKLVGGVLIVLGVGRVLDTILNGGLNVATAVGILGAALVVWSGAIFFPPTRSRATRGLFRGRPRKKYREALAYTLGFIVLILGAMVLV